ncbi:MAG: hypothetical protein K2F65_00080, partial [Eubacterium sp.]|nr:hypothetical protein [Eubacterium sp.]
GSIELCKEIQKENANNNSFDEEHYWEEINNDEAKGNKFVDICKDYVEFEKDVFNHILKYYFPILKHPSIKKLNPLLLIFGVLIFSIIRGITGVLIWKNESFFDGFLTPFICFIMVSIIVTPLFLLKDKHPKLVSIIITILFIAAILLLIGIALLIIYAIISKVFNL